MSLRLKLLLLGSRRWYCPGADASTHARWIRAARRGGELTAGGLPDHRRIAPGRTDLLYRESVPPADAPDPLNPRDFRPRLPAEPPERPRPLALTRAPLLDGYSDDWRATFRVGVFRQDDRHRFAILTGVYERMLYLLLEVRDEHRCSMPPGPTRWTGDLR